MNPSRVPSSSGLFHKAALWSVFAQSGEEDPTPIWDSSSAAASPPRSDVKPHKLVLPRCQTPSPGEGPLAKGLSFCSGRAVPRRTDVTGLLNNRLWNDLRSSEGRCSSSSRNRSGFVKVSGCLLWEESDSPSSVIKWAGRFAPMFLAVKGGTNCRSPNNQSPKYSFLFLLREASPALTFYSQYSRFCEWLPPFPAIGRLTEDRIPQERSRLR